MSGDTLDVVLFVVAILVIALIAAVSVWDTKRLLRKDAEAWR